MAGNSDDIAPDIKRQIIEQEIAGYRNGRYQMQLRYRVAKSLNQNTSKIEEELQHIEQAIDVLQQELEAL